MLKLSWPASRATLCKLERRSSRLTESIVLWRDNESFPRSIAPLRKDYVPLPWMAISTYVGCRSERLSSASASHKSACDGGPNAAG